MKHFYIHSLVAAVCTEASLAASRRLLLKRCRAELAIPCPAVVSKWSYTSSCRIKVYNVACSAQMRELPVCKMLSVRFIA